MIALDTNVLVRVVTADEPQQLAAALKVFRSDTLWVSKTVLLEIEWVLRYTYAVAPEGILDALRRLLGYRDLEVEDRVEVLKALSLFKARMDFADSLHLASGAGADLFATFDRALARRATRAGAEGLPPVELLAPKKR